MASDCNDVDNERAMSPFAAERLAKSVLEHGPVRHVQRALGTDASGVYLVGGAVRDLALGRVPTELDLAVERDPERVCESLVAGGAVVTERHPRFGTAKAALGEDVVDIAATRTEIYPRPGSLPEVSPGTIWDDVERRDFSINAIAVGISGDCAGAVVATEGALADLESGVLRVLHPDSFFDDPTRLWRLARYGARLGFAVERKTRALAEDAVSSGAMRTVSGPRHGAELIRTAAAAEPELAMAKADDLGLLHSVGLAHWDQRRYELGSEILGGGSEECELRIAICFLDVPDGGRLATDLQLPSRLHRACAEAADSSRTRSRLEAASGKLEIHSICSALLPVTLAVIADGGTAGAAVRLWFDNLSRVANPISGADLVSAGIKPGPSVQIGLDAALEWVLESGDSSKETALAKALDAVTGRGGE